MPQVFDLQRWVAENHDHICACINRKLENGVSLGRGPIKAQQQSWADGDMSLAEYINDYVSDTQLRRLRQAVRTRKHRDNIAPPTRAEVNALKDAVTAQAKLLQKRESR